MVLGAQGPLTPLQAHVLTPSCAGVQLSRIWDLYHLTPSSDSESKPRNESKVDFLLEFWTERSEPHAFLFSLQHKEGRELFLGPGLSVVMASTSARPSYHSGDPPDEMSREHCRVTF